MEGGRTWDWPALLEDPPRLWREVMDARKCLRDREFQMVALERRAARTWMPADQSRAPTRRLLPDFLVALRDIVDDVLGLSRGAVEWNKEGNIVHVINPPVLRDVLLPAHNLRGCVASSGRARPNSTSPRPCPSHTRRARPARPAAPSRPSSDN